ncbi:Plant intracellular Ras-group-related LRR protein [Actinidia chinensis var. chinensis]|uniref:Plant intracellular Ras-group-related LRR protein n=1 Tax=Actinidia chinensis var. chinensis TaxID=1590841 RepID=A0A2R6PDI6_ACTCC|nr:Plant intracellular Ras-group-related LRR protein [Actinidia chinensis var. chinensis]
MTATPKRDPDPSPAYAESVQEIMNTYKSLPPRPPIEDVEAAKSVLQTLKTEQETKLEEISSQVCPQGVPPELFSLLQQVRKAAVLFHCHEQSKEALYLVEIDKLFQAFDELIQRASELVSGGTQIEKQSDFENPIREIEKEVVFEERKSGFEDLKGDGGLKGLVRSSSSDGKIGGGLKGLVESSSSKSTIFTSAIIGGGDTEKLSLIKVAALIENSAKSGAVVLDLRGKLIDKMEWLPESLGKLSNIYELNLSENRIMALPSTIGGLTALTKLDIHSNQLINLPESFGELVNLTDLDLHANMLKSLPPSFGNLTNIVNLDLASNLFTRLPDVIGNLTSLKSLNAETNELEELPYTIGSCSSLVEMRLDFNQLKALPEAIGKLECLEVLSLHYNKIKRLPTTMSNLGNLRELDVSFNELEFIPESLCLATSLVKLNVGKNFADLRALPKSIGNLEMLEELDISDDQIRVLPDSFKFLSKLRVFHADETPLEVPPRQVAKLGAQAVVKYMTDFVAKRDASFLIPKKKKKKGFWSRVCPLFCH